MVDVAQYINEVKRDSDTLLILRDIELSIPDWIKPPGTDLHHYGRLIIDGELRIKAHNDQKQKLRYVFVFDTVLVLCKAMKVRTSSWYTSPIQLLLNLKSLQYDDHACSFRWTQAGSSQHSMVISIRRQLNRAWIHRKEQALSLEFLCLGI